MNHNLANSVSQLKLEGRLAVTISAHEVTQLQYEIFVPYILNLTPARKQTVTKSKVPNHTFSCDVAHRLRQDSGMDPPLRDLFFQRDATRRSVIASYWLVIILALPLWWHTTTIHRLSLPSSRVEAIARNELLIPISICLVTNDHSLPEKLRYHLGRSTDYWKVLDVHIFGDSDCSSLGMFYCVLMIRF